MDILYGIALSMHLGFEGEYNAVHPHLRLQNNQFITGAYYNSEKSVSYYTGIEIGNNQWNYEMGLVTGYTIGEIQPFFRSTYEINDNTIMFIAPGLEKDNLGLVIGIELWNK